MKGRTVDRLVGYGALQDAARRGGKRLVDLTTRGSRGEQAKNSASDRKTCHARAQDCTLPEHRDRLHSLLVLSADARAHEFQDVGQRYLRRLVRGSTFVLD